MSVTVTDVGGRLKSLERRAKKELRECLYGALDRTTFAMAQRMRAGAAVGPDAPHMRDFITTARRGLKAKVGFIDVTELGRPGGTWSIADVAMGNEYSPNKQPFMRPAAEAEASDAVKRFRAAILLTEQNLSGGGGLL